MSNKSLSHYISNYFTWSRVSITVPLLILIAHWYFYPIILDAGLCDEFCSYELKMGVLAPLHEVSHVFIATLALLFVLRASYIRRWLYYVVSWFVPIAIILIASQPITSGGFLPMPDRSIALVLLAASFFAITILSIVFFFLYDCWCLYRARKNAELL